MGKRNPHRYGSYRKNKAKFIAMLLDQNKLDCHYCGSKDLILKAHNDRNIPDHRKFSLDHIVPISRGGKLSDISNFRSCCKKCNQEKSDSLNGINFEMRAVS